jgi:hypothetical protein
VKRISGEAYETALVEIWRPNAGRKAPCHLSGECPKFQEMSCRNDRSARLGLKVVRSCGKRGERIIKAAYDNQPPEISAQHKSKFFDRLTTHI